MKVEESLALTCYNRLKAENKHSCNGCMFSAFCPMTMEVRHKHETLQPLLYSKNKTGADTFHRTSLQI